MLGRMYVSFSKIVLNGLVKELTADSLQSISSFS